MPVRAPALPPSRGKPDRGRHHTDHQSTAATATGHWEGKAATAFDRKARTMTRALDATAAASLDVHHRAVAHLVDEYTTKAGAILDSVRAVQGAGQRAALLRAVGQVVDLVRTYTNESVKHLRTVQREMQDAKLERRVEHDGHADPGKRRGSGGGGVVARARGQLGYHEGPAT